MKFKYNYNYLIAILVMSVGFFLLKYSMPKYTFQYIFMVMIILADLYLWSSVKKQVFNYRNWLRVLIISIYWLPLGLLAVFFIGSFIVPLIDWSNPIRTYLLGVIFVFYTAKLLPITFLILADLVRVIQKLFLVSKKDQRTQIIDANKSEGISRSKFLQYAGFVTGGLVLGTMFTGMLKWAYEFKVIFEKISFAKLPKSFEGFKIVQVSDIHLGSWASPKPLQRAVDIINDIDADVILFTGDLVNYATSEVAGFEEILSQLKAKKGVYAILGNHDYGNYISWPSKASKEQNMTDLYAFFDQVGWKLLRNENEIFHGPDGDIAIVGVENWGASPRFPKYGDLDKALVGAENADVKILMTHDPSHWEKVVIPKNYDIDLSLSGHTHGFQFGLETKDFKWSPAKYMYKHWAGLYEDQNKSGKYIYVNRGLGSIGYPGRIGMLPEITLIELHKA